MQLQNYEANGLVSLWNCLVFADRLALGDSFFSYSNLLVFGWAEIPESRVPAYPIVESLDVLETATLTDSLVGQDRL